MLLRVDIWFFYNMCLIWIPVISWEVNNAESDILIIMFLFIFFLSLTLKLFIVALSGGDMQVAMEFSSSRESVSMLWYVTLGGWTIRTLVISINWINWIQVALFKMLFVSIEKKFILMN